jgi:hypothetical protein
MWDSERRGRFLFRQDIECILSVDSTVWPSVFDTADGLVRPDWTGYVQDIWDNLPALSRVVRPMALLGLDSVHFIAIELVGSSCSKGEFDNWCGRVPDVGPENLTSLPHEFLGYDVADYFLLSGLTNCQISNRSNISYWPPLLNKNHLFRELDSAIEFKNETNRVVPEHAPFFVFALWQIEPDGTLNVTV